MGVVRALGLLQARHDSGHSLPDADARHITRPDADSDESGADAPADTARHNTYHDAGDDGHAAPGPTYADADGSHVQPRDVLVCRADAAVRTARAAAGAGHGALECQLGPAMNTREAERAEKKEGKR